MVFVPAQDVLKCDFRQSLYGQEISNTIYLKGLQPPVLLSDMETVAEELETWWTLSIAPEVVDALTLREVYVTDLSTQTSPTYTHVPTTLPTGDLAVTGVPGNVAFCVSFRSAGRGRSSRGRNYVAGLAETDVSGNTYDNTRIANLVSAYDQLRTIALFQGYMQWSIVSTYENKLPRAQALVQPVVAAIATDTVVDSQRRRLTGRGR